MALSIGAKNAQLQKRCAMLGAELIRAFSAIFTSELANFFDAIPDFSIIAIKPTTDLKLAKVYCNMSGLCGSQQTSDEILAILNANKSKIRTALAAEINIKYMPDLAFYIQPTKQELDALLNHSIAYKRLTDANL